MTEVLRMTIVESGRNQWVWLMGRGYQEVGVASGWNLWVWLVSAVVRRYIIDILIIIITFPYSTCISTRRDQLKSSLYQEVHNNQS